VVNDHVIDTPGEAIYIRDENTGEVWSPTALPIRDDNATYVARHGQGYTRFQHASHGLTHELVQFVPSDDPIKISRLTLQNTSGRARRLSITAYAEWVLGSSRSAQPTSLQKLMRPRASDGTQCVGERIWRPHCVCGFCGREISHKGSIGFLRGTAGRSGLPRSSEVGHFRNGLALVLTRVLRFRPSLN
jgi:hypothetical protein